LDEDFLTSPTFKFLKEEDRDDVLDFILSDDELNEENQEFYQPKLDILESDGFNKLIS